MDSLKSVKPGEADTEIMINWRVFLLYILSLVLFSLSALDDYSFLICLSIAPLVLLNNQLKKRGFHSVLNFSITFLPLFLYTWFSLNWLWSVNPKIIVACVIYSLFFCIPFHFISKKLSVIDLLGFLSSWIFLEYLFTQGQLAFPFFALGNTLAKFPE